MPQEFHVLRCYKCEFFQVQQVKKANKWTCKLCGEKQSVVREYGKGSGKDCRIRVQALNAMAGDVQGSGSLDEGAIQRNNEEIERGMQDFSATDKCDASRAKVSVSKWAKYIDGSSSTAPDVCAQTSSAPRDANHAGKDETGQCMSHGYPGEKLEATRPSPNKVYKALLCATRAHDTARVGIQPSVDLQEVRPSSADAVQQCVDSSKAETSSRSIFSRLGMTQPNDEDFSVDF